MPEPPFQNDMRTQGLPPRPPIAHSGSALFAGSGSLALLTVIRLEEIPAALAQGITERKAVLIDIPAFQWRASLLATIQKWGGEFSWWLVKTLAALLLGQWLLAQGLSVPDWAKFNFVRQPDNKIILSPHEE